MSARTFDGEAMSILLNMLPKGAEKISAVKEYIKEADEAKETYYQLTWRYEHAYLEYFYGDPVKTMPIASEFTQIYEANPHALDSVPDNGGAESYVMITQMGLDNVVALPQVSMEEWENMMEQFHVLVKRFNLGHKVYWWQLARFWQYIDKEKAYQYFQRFWKTGRDGLSDCRACERCYAVHMSLLAGDRKAADEYAKPLKAGRTNFCNDAPKLYRYYYLEDALDRGDLKEAVTYAGQLSVKLEHRPHDLSFIGAVVRCFAYTDMDKAVKKFEYGMDLALGLWDQIKVYDYFKGAYVCFHELAKDKDTVILDLPAEFPLYRKDGVYHCNELRQWFYEQAEKIGDKFDKRNGSHYFKENLAKALLNM
ncbi:MAG: hypothetical protein K2N44_09375 [Lachnospiraceae bacterium]|nr:hypothetical protein [Lachnospiraceae bacterium]